MNRQREQNRGEKRRAAHCGSESGFQFGFSLVHTQNLFSPRMKADQRKTDPKARHPIWPWVQAPSPTAQKTEGCSTNWGSSNKTPSQWGGVDQSPLWHSHSVIRKLSFAAIKWFLLLHVMWVHFIAAKVTRTSTWILKCLISMEERRIGDRETATNTAHALAFGILSPTAVRRAWDWEVMGDVRTTLIWNSTHLLNLTSAVNNALPSA